MKYLRQKNAKEAGYAVFGKELFESFFKNYTEKQWGRLAETLPPDLFSRYQIRWDDNNEAFAGQFQGIPETSYDDLFKSIVSHANETYSGSIDIIYNIMQIFLLNLKKLSDRTDTVVEKYSLEILSWNCQANS